MEIQKQKIGRWICSVLLILIVPNCIFWILAPKISFSRGVFVAEYLLIACLYPYINRKLFITIWILFTLYDLICSATSLFFMDFMEMTHALAKIPAISFIDLMKWAGILILFIAIVFALVKVLIRYDASYPVLRIRFLWPLLVIMVVLFLPKKGLVSFQSWQFIKTVQHVVIKGTARRNVEYLGSAAKKAFGQEPPGTAATKEALILVESWGFMNDSTVRHEVVQPLYELVKNNKYTIKEGKHPFKYLTQQCEYRELTGYLFRYYQVRDKWVKENSILIKKQEQGYHIIGLHGNTGKFYHRDIIWPVLGVQEMYFSEQFVSMKMPLCGNEEFRGICDTTIVTWLLNKMNGQPERKEFYYWVTLNTHLPLVEIHDEGYNNFAKKYKERGITENTLQECYQQKLLFQDLAVKLGMPGSPKAHILLVGDHAPPFLDPHDRAMYDAQYVPYIELIPN